jgi:diguanylate cyclase (GGDEF)-like protein
MWIIESGIPIAIEISKNAILLFALVFLYSISNFNLPSTLKKRIGLGLIIGVSAILIMMAPWRFAEGLIFDTRSILYLVTGLFFGFIPTAVAAILGITYRIFFVGSRGVYAGVLTILTTSFLGVYWNQIKTKLPKMNRFIEYYVVGLIAHLFVVIGFLTIPWPDAFETIKNTALPFLGFFPIFTMLLAVTIDNQRYRLQNSIHIQNQKALLQASIDSPKSMEIFAIDTKYRYLTYNQFHAQNILIYYNKNVSINSSYLDNLDDLQMKTRIQHLIDIALSGESINRVVEVETAKGKFLEELYSPIRNDYNEIIGVTIISQDITERKEYEESIIYLSYRDPLTNLFNRRYYTEELIKLDHPKYLPLSIIMIDINGLKITNDAFGHHIGDQLLCSVADELRTSFKSERVARIGGDEFVVILPNTSNEKAKKMIDKAKNTVEKNMIRGMNISVSFGLSTKIDNQFIDQTIKLAEDDMYAHKLFEISSHRNETIKTILKTLYEKNPREEQHSKRVSIICTEIGIELGMKKDDINLLKAISNLHDIGKIAIDDAILNKPGKLEPHEWDAIKRHPEIGYRILSSTPEYAEIAQDILSHHEKFDGTGYPRGLKEDEIPIRARIISLADAYDAMISDRPYRRAMTHQEAIDELIKCKGTQFDPYLVDVFMKIFKNNRVE